MKTISTKGYTWSRIVAIHKHALYSTTGLNFNDFLDNYYWLDQRTQRYIQTKTLGDEGIALTVAKAAL